MFKEPFGPIIADTVAVASAGRVCGCWTSLASAMPEDKKKVLQALAAKRKADNEAGGKRKPKLPAAATPKKTIPKLGHDKPKFSPASKGKEMSRAAPKGKPVAKKPEKWDSASDTSEEDDVSDASEEDHGDEGSEDEGPKRKVSSAKQSAATPPAKKSKSSGLAVFKEKDGKGKEPAKDMGKGKKKVDDSDEENGVDDDDGGDLSEDPLDEVNPDNILPSRTRRRTSQPVQYDYGSGDEDEDDSDA